jgi:hypothetical protein
VTLFAELIVTVQTFPLTVVQPVQRAKVELPSGVAVSVTTLAGVVFATVAVQVVPPQVSVGPSAVTVPFPGPVIATFSANAAGLK